VKERDPKIPKILCGKMLKFRLAILIEIIGFFD
jgi:hypothetical protein